MELYCFTLDIFHTFCVTIVDFEQVNDNLNMAVLDCVYIYLIGMKKCLFTREFHPGMKRVEFHPGMKFNLKENLSLSMMKTYNKISHFSQLLKSEVPIDIWQALPYIYDRAFSKK